MSSTSLMPFSAPTPADDLDQLMAKVQGLLQSNPLVTSDSYHHLLGKVASGPFRVSFLDLERHTMQRPLVDSHIETLQEHLSKLDARFQHPVYVYVPTDVWAASQRRVQEVTASTSVNDLPALERDSTSPLWKTLTHGHRIAALANALETSTKYSEALLEMYGKEMWWVAHVVPEGEYFLLFMPLPCAEVL